MAASSCLYFVVTGIQFWISDYMITVLGSDESFVLTAYAAISITAPTFGVFLGGKISDSMGGYTGKHALTFCLSGAVLAAGLCLPIPWYNNQWLVALHLWGIFFAGGGVLPTLTGLMLSSIPQHMRNIGSSVSQFVQTLTGYLPAPVIYGYLVQLSGRPKSRWGMFLLMLWSLMGVLALSVAKVMELNRRRIKNKKRRRKGNRLSELKEQIKDRESGADKSLVAPIEDIELEIPTYELNRSPMPVVDPDSEDLSGLYTPVKSRGERMIERNQDKFDSVTNMLSRGIQKKKVNI